MTPSELNTYVRQAYNAVSDSFYADTELYSYMYDAEMQLARETKCIRAVYSTPTVASQQEYTRPSRAVAIKRITYEGAKLLKISDKIDDLYTLNNQATTATGTPMYYWEWGTTIYLRPVPDAIGTLNIYSFDQPDTVSATSVFEVPSRYHTDIANFVLWRMALKDKNFDIANAYNAIWNKSLSDAKKYEAKNLRGDGFTGVMDEFPLPTSSIGAL
tara:strand:- start:9218 stop:9862 length:645 start_codon:yes stop_codon:yes gene_type:complete